MSGKVLFESVTPVTQTIASVKALAQFLSLKEALPQVINLANGARLSLSSKKDCYYYTNSRSCSCRAGQFGRSCKHRKALLEGASSSQASRREEARISVAQSRSQAQTYQARQRQLKAQVKEISSQVMGEEPLVQRGGFRPFVEA